MPQTDNAVSKLDLRKKALDAALGTDETKPLSCREKLMKAGKSAAEADAQCTEHEFNTQMMNKADKNIFRSK